MTSAAGALGASRGVAPSAVGNGPQAAPDLLRADKLGLTCGVVTPDGRCVK